MTTIKSYYFYTEEPEKVDYNQEAVIELKIVDEPSHSYIALWVYDKQKITGDDHQYEQQAYTKGVITTITFRFDNYFDMLKKIYPVVVESITFQKRI